MKKKKKKKSTFDLDAALADGNDAGDQAEKEDAAKDEDGGMDFDENLDLESFGKKKKKKKKPFNLDEIESSLPVDENADADAMDADKIGGETGDAMGGDEDYDLDVDFSKTKKKKKKKKDLDELVAEKLEEDIQTVKDNGKIFHYFILYNHRNLLKFKFKKKIPQTNFH